MIRSMTGYGRDQQLLHGRSITVEIRSVNHRYFEFSCRAPRGCAFLEDRLKRALQSAISRGKVEVALTLQTVESRNTSVAVDHALAGQYITALRALGEEYALPDDLTLSTVCRLPDIFTLCRGEEDEEELAADVLSVLQKALELGHKVIVVVNKIDRPDARVHEVMDEVLELLLDLNATEEQFDSPTIFCSAREGTSSYGPDDKGTDLIPLFETIVNYIDPPKGDENGPLQVLVSSIDYNEFVGRMGIGRIERGTIHQNQEVIVCDYHDPSVKKKEKVVALYEFTGLGRSPIQQASAGEIVAFSGISDITIGRTLCDLETVEPLPFVKISDPTIEMTFSVNDSPFAGREGKYVTSRNLRDRLQRELLKDVSLHVTEMGTDAFNVAGRGEMHLSILIETMRREGYEFQVSTPHVLNKTIDGKLCEPIERMIADVPENSVGSVIDKISQRKGDLVSMTPIGSRMRLEFLVPTRGLFGYRNEFLTDTRGEGIMASTLDSYAPVKGEISRRLTGSLVAFETGETTAYGIGGVQDRGSMFIGPGVEVYAGMIVGQCNRNEDMAVNVCKKKQLTNMRAAGSDAAIRLVPPTVLSLEQCMEYLADDELLEVTPKNLRMRKRQLDHSARMRALMKSRQ